MIKSKKINIMALIAAVFALIISFACIEIGNIKGKNSTAKNEAEYASKIFSTDIISIEIIADESDWKEMLNNAMSEQYIMADVIVNGTKFNNVGIRPKGNSSLAQVANSDSNRYSFRLQFDEYIKGQTCFGLDSFVINNILGDNTYMKEYISYDLMCEAGVDGPYFGYADIKVNGEKWGLYLAVEMYNDSYEQRVYGDTSGMLYNVKSMDMSRRNENWPGGQGERPKDMPDMKNPDMQNGWTQMPFDGQFQQSPNFQKKPQSSQQNSNGKPDFQPSPNTDNTNFSPPNFPTQLDNKNFGRGGIFGGRGGGGSLEYSDDNPESYNSIFGNVVGKGAESDYQRVVQALKALSEGNDLETYFDVDQILRYLAAHTIVVNLDSYSSSMAQNYYIYECDGQITILPWDYNLAWGGFQNGNASSVINFPIDTPVSGVEMSNRPLIAKLFENPKYLDQYHSYLQQLMDNYFANGKFERKINELDALISEYVKNDPTEFCTYEVYKSSLTSFITLGNLRAQSVQGQLDGTIPSTKTEQNSNPSQLVSAGNLNLSDLGSMMGGRGDNNKMNFAKEIREEQSAGMIHNDMGRNPLGDMSNSFERSVFREQGLKINNLAYSGGLLLLLIGALLFVREFKKSY